MKRSLLAVLTSCLFCLFATGCPGGGSSSSGGGGGGGGGNTLFVSNGPTPTAVSCPAAPGSGSVTVTGSNVISVQIGGNAYCSTNMPCASVKVCQPGSTTNCQTINNLLVDTGSFGLRIFNSAFTYSTALLPAVTASGLPVAECAEFGSANTWGPVVQADVYLGPVAGGEPVISSMPIQLIESGYQSIPSGSPCASSAAQAPGDSDSPFNGILGVGFQPYDDYGIYYSCTGGTCSSLSSIASSQEVINPVYALGPTGDSNGVILDMPSVGGDQASGATGALILGIGTGSHSGNNTPGAVSTYFASSLGYVPTYFGGANLTESFLDSGSNLLYFTAGGMTECGDGFYCLSQTACYSATISGHGGSSSAAQSVTFKVLAEYSVVGSDYANDALAANGGMTDSFDWGMPFFFGRKVYVGMYGQGTPLGAGPLFAF